MDAILTKKNKKYREYLEKYSDVPKIPSEIFLHLMKSLRVNEKDLIKLRSEIHRITGISRDKISIVFYFTPQATPRPRASGTSMRFYVKNHLDYNKIFGEFVSYCDNMKSIIATPCRMLVKTYSPIPSNMNRVEALLAELGFIPHISKPDWDNLGKTYSDMVQKHLILDDSLIYDGRVVKGYSARPRIEIEIEYMKDYDSKYNKRKIESWTHFSE